MNKQREAVYGLRRQLMEGVDQKQLITEDYVSTILSNILEEHAPEKSHPDEWKLDAIFSQVYDVFGAKLDSGPDAIDAARSTATNSAKTIFEKVRARYDIKEKILGAPAMRYHERIVMLSVLDGLWKDHLLAMDHLKEGIGLRGYAQQDPLVAYKKESFEMFEAMMMQFQQDTARHLFRMQIIGPDGKPIETAEQMQAAQTPARPRTPRRPRFPCPSPARSMPPSPSTPAPLPPPSTSWKKSFSARSVASWNRPAPSAPARAPLPPSASPEKKSAATTPAPAAPAKNTKNATAPPHNWSSVVSYQSFVRFHNCY